jgi:hypothetical protein
MQSSLQSALNELIAQKEINPWISQIAGQMHDVFEAILVEALIENPGQNIDGAAILAICMKTFKEVSYQEASKTIVPSPQGLPSTRLKK